MSWKFYCFEKFKGTCNFTCMVAKKDMGIGLVWVKKVPNISQGSVATRSRCASVYVSVVLGYTLNSVIRQWTVFLGRPFVKRFAFVKRFTLCYRTVVMSVLSVTSMYCGQTVGCIKMKLGMEVDLGPGHIVLDGNAAPLPHGHSPQFSAHVCCGRMAGLIKMPLGTEVSLGTGDIVLDRDPATPKRSTAPQF